MYFDTANPISARAVLVFERNQLPDSSPTSYPGLRAVRADQQLPAVPVKSRSASA
jgi:hypothetical protein